MGIRWGLGGIEGWLFTPLSLLLFVRVFSNVFFSFLYLLHPPSLLFFRWFLVHGHTLKSRIG